MLLIAVGGIAFSRATLTLCFYGSLNQASL
jgi:hypothetical protein